MSQVARSKSSRKNLPKTVPSASAIPSLTASDVQSYGRTIRSIQIDDLFGDGTPRLVHYRALPLRASLEVQKAQEDDMPGSKIIEMIVSKLSQMLTDEKGNRLLTEDQLQDLPSDTLMSLFNKITNTIAEERRGNGSSGGEVATSSDSSTD